MNETTWRQQTAARLRGLVVKAFTARRVEDIGHNLWTPFHMSLIHTLEPTRPSQNSHSSFCLQKQYRAIKL